MKIRKTIGQLYLTVLLFFVAVVSGAVEFLECFSEDMNVLWKL